MTWNLADLFESVVDVVPDREALVVPNAVGGEQRLTFAQLDERANRLAHALSERGVQPGDKVGVYGYNSAEWVEAQWAKVDRALTALEDRWASHLSGPLDMGQIAVGAALGYLDFRQADRDWRAGRPRLSAWYDRFAARPSMQETLPKA